MATQEVITYVCDLCDFETQDADKIETHTLGLDRQAAEVDSCGPCWEDFGPRLKALIAAGRRQPKMRLAG